MAYQRNRKILTPKISIIATNYNNEDFLEQMVSSVIDQTVQSWELIVIDDGSTDKSPQLLKEFANLDSRIFCYFLKSNQGAAAAFNVGLKKAKSNIIGRIDSDDALESNALETMIFAHERNPDCSLICSHAWECDESLKRIQKWPGYSPPNGNSLITNCTVGHFATFKRSLLPEDFALDQNIRRAVDLDLYLRLEEHGHIFFIDDPLYLYRRNQRGISQLNSGIHAYQWSRLVRLNASKRRKEFKLSSHLSSATTKKLAYEWMVFELRNEGGVGTKFEVVKLAFSFYPKIVFNPKFYYHLVFS